MTASDEPAAPADDDEEVRAFVRAEPDAVRAAYRAHAPAVARVISRMGIPSHDVQDLVQSTFLQAIAGAARFEQRSSTKAWLLGIALNVARNFLRGAVRGRRAATKIPASFVAPDVDGPDVDRLRAAIAALPDLQREAVILCELEELSAKEVSALLGVPPATVWRRVHDGRVSLRRALAVEEDDR